MASLRVPSVQHLARNWRDEPITIAKALVRLAENPPTFNYNPLFGALRDYLMLHVPYEDVVAGIAAIKRVAVRENLLGVMPLIREHFDGVSPEFFQGVDRRYYPVGRGLMVPFEPPMIYGIGGQLYFPWFSFWRRNPLSDERLSLFVTLVEEILLQDPDLESARFEILDFSSSDAKSPRMLRVIDARDVPRLSEERKRQMLECFAEGYFQALAMLATKAKETAPSERPDAPRPDPLQPDLF
ncbi:hypothetical protein FHT98_3299 [Bosea sp. AK1]|uniref:hypothetical protein n=1 Tax=Bosea sp. AK1 TaxID=2587160 RepID=UPI0011505E88|nr:hypothetical protein [Bosea sp. AK1]TQI75518.1 hypothetical protein FHT98_3299 [Bosea sp. AK1]